MPEIYPRYASHSLQVARVVDHTHGHQLDAARPSSHDTHGHQLDAARPSAVRDTAGSMGATAVGSAARVGAGFGGGGGGRDAGSVSSVSLLLDDVGDAINTELARRRAQR